MFQSTRPRGARLPVAPCYCGCKVSIHAPTWGATSTAFELPSERCFNPRAHVGRDIAAITKDWLPYGFNPRAHVGRDQAASARHEWHDVSIHAPTWGATDGHGNKTCYRIVSIHAPTWGATDRDLSHTKKKQFQSTRPRGARHDFNDVYGTYFVFQSTRPRGARLSGIDVIA